MMFELDDVPVESLVPEPLRNTSSVVEFMDRLPEFDDEMSQKLEEAETAGECLRYVGIVDCEGMQYFRCNALFERWLPCLVQRATKCNRNECR